MRRGKDKFAEEFALVFELMRWFKYDFFKWMNSPECEKCKCSSTFKGFSQRPEDLVKANRVEVSRCSLTGHLVLSVNLMSLERARNIFIFQIRMKKELK